MKNHKLLKVLFLLMLSIALVNCTSDDPIPGPMGPQGTAGTNGTNGTNGLNGADGGNICLSCHNVDYKVVQNATYAVSGHGIGAAKARVTSSDACMTCHSHEGYLGAYATGNISAAVPGVTRANSTIHVCSTCHSGGHAAAGLAISGKDAALRTVDAYKLVGSGTIGTIIDYKNNSNNCIHCHQIRRAGAGYPATNGLITVGSHHGPHYGGAVNMLEGIDAIEIPGALTYPADGSNAHRTGASCTSCHMGKAKDGQGNHSMKPVLDNCKKCHTGAGVVNYDINGGKTKIKNLMKELAAEIVRTANGYSLDADGYLVLPSSNTPTAELIAQAVYNYRFLYQDHSYGLHNPKYAETLMKNSIAAIKALPNK